MTTREEQIRTRFEEFHDDNPQIWELFERFTLLLINKGFRHYSADAVVHRIRWHTAVDTGSEGEKINNNFTAYYARFFHQEHPAHRGFFRSRSQVSRGIPVAGKVL
jgi:hypothetical protein